MFSLVVIRTHIWSCWVSCLMVLMGLNWCRPYKWISVFCSLSQWCWWKGVSCKEAQPVYLCFAHLKRGDVTCASSSSSLHIQTYKIHKLTSKMKSAWYDASTKTPRNKLLFKSRIFIIFESFVAHMSHKPKQRVSFQKTAPIRERVWYLHVVSHS